MNKYLPMIAAVVLMSPAMAFALQCAEGEVEVPAVTHTEEVEVVDEPAYCAVPEPEEPEEPSDSGSDEVVQSQPTSGGGGPCHPSTGFPECQQNAAYFVWYEKVLAWQDILQKLQILIWKLEEAQN